MTSRALLVPALLAALVLGACGSGGDDATSSATTAAATPVTTALSAAQQARVRSALLRWAKTKDPEIACHTMSGGFALFVGDGTLSGCPKNVFKTVGALHDADTVVRTARYDDGQAVVAASVDGAPRTFFLVPDGAAWKINSIGVRKPTQGP